MAGSSWLQATLSYTGERHLNYLGVLLHFVGGPCDRAQKCTRSEVASLPVSRDFKSKLTVYLCCFHSTGMTAYTQPASSICAWPLLSSPAPVEFHR